MATGMTPIVLAIQAGHVDVVRELLNAGAVVPPPQVTMDPIMLSILYPQPTMYGIPPPFAQMAPPPFYPPQGYYPAPVRTPPGASQNGAPNGTANGSANLPPAEVAKTIPCRNFPNCKYGASCMFFHPRMQPGFFPPAYGYEQGFVPYPGTAPFFPGSQEFVTAANGAPVDGAVVDEAAAADPNATQHDSIPAQAQAAQTHVPSAGAPAFVPGMAVEQNGAFIGSPTGAYAMGPMSPSLLPTPPPPMPNDPAFFATSPPQFQAFVPNGGYPGHGRRPSFGQPFTAGGPPTKPFHGKKLSFSGGPKPWGPGGRPGGSSHLGQWKDGHPPPCAFFREGKCRNGDICKFPHIDAEGNDVRHPDVIRGIMAPAPTRPPPRHLRMMGGAGHYDPRHQQNQLHFNKSAPAQVAETPEGEVAAADAAAAPATEAAPAASAPATAAASPSVASDKEVAPASSLPPKPSSSVPASRSASQPGVARVHANGVSSRSHSPNGVRRGPRGAFPNGQANGSRSSSTGGENKKAVPPQRIPRADEFPALGINGAVTPTTERREPSWGAKTAAQVLSAPAPPKAESSETSSEADVPASVSDKEDVADEVVVKTASSTVDDVTMDSESEQDAVIVSVSTTPNPEVAKAKLASAVSFAAVAMATTEAAPVALKA